MEFILNRAEVLKLHHLKVTCVETFESLETVVAVGGGILKREGARHLWIGRPDHVPPGVEERPVLLVVGTVEFP